MLGYSFGIELMALCMLGKHLTTELQCTFYLTKMYLLSEAHGLHDIIILFYKFKSMIPYKSQKQGEML